MQRFTKRVVAEQPHVFAQVDVGHPLVAADDHHILVVVLRGSDAEIGRTGNHDKVFAQDIR